MFTDATWNVLPDSLVTVRLFGPSVNSTVPLGFTVKLTVPPLCFENTSGLGLVETWIVHGVGVGLGFTGGDPDGEADGDAEGLASGDG